MNLPLEGVLSRLDASFIWIADAVLSHVAAVEGSERGRRDVPREGGAHRPRRVRIRPHQDLHKERENGEDSRTTFM